MMRSLQFNLKSLMLAVSLAAVLVWTVLMVIARTRHNFEVTRSAYAAQAVAYMCIEHMRANDNSWPKNWDELDDDFAVGIASSGQQWTWEFPDLQHRVDVDWLVDPARLRTEQTLRPIIWIADAPERECFMASPNEIVLRYLASTSAPAE